MTKRDLRLYHEDIYRNLEIIPAFNFYITEINSKHQSSVLLSLKVELMLSWNGFALLKRLKSFR